MVLLSGHKFYNWALLKKEKKKKKDWEWDLPSKAITILAEYH